VNAPAAMVRPGKRAGSFTARRSFLSRAGVLGGCLLSLALLGRVADGALPGMQQAFESDWMEQAHEIGLALFSYANDNNQTYPDGKSSTEVFQKLLDGGYITDPTIFFLPLPGKTKAAGGKLKPENVGFDVTGGADSSSPDGLPLVFMTGYKVTYAAGGAAVPLATPYPPGIAACYKSNNSKFMRGAGADGSIPNFVPANFDAGGRTYRQLTPDGSTP